MKTLLLSAACLIILGSQAFAGQNDYKCIADSLQAYNSDIYYNLSQSEIDEMLNDSLSYGHSDATRVASTCQAAKTEAKNYKCVANALEAYNSDVYYNLSNSEIDNLLQNSDVAGHTDALRAARICSKNR